MKLNEILSCYDRNQARWEKLKKRYEDSSIVPFIGAGMSAPIYPMWKDVLRNILRGNKDENEKLEDLFAKGKFEDAGAFVCERVGKTLFGGRMEEEFSASKLTKDNICSVNSYYLKDVFRCPIFTTNYDNVIETSYGTERINSYTLSNMVDSSAVIHSAIRDRRSILIKIHGDINDANSLVISEEQYDLVYGRERFVKAIETVCESLNFLFLGCSLTEGDRYVQILENVVSEFEKKEVHIHNYAFLSLPEKGDQSDEQYNYSIEERERFLGKIGIYPIWYPTGMHEAIPVLLDSLKKKKKLVNVFEKDQTGKEKHFNLFSSKIHVEQAFVDGCFNYYQYNDGLEPGEEKPIDFKAIMELVQSNNLLYIEGAYGSGKTILSTRIQYELRKNDIKTLFFDAWDFNDDNRLYEELEHISEKLFVFVDGLDKLIDTSLDITPLERNFSIINEIIKNNKNITFLINSREYYKMASSKKEDGERISMHACAAYEKGELNVIRTIGFMDREKYESFFKKINPSPSSTSVTLSAKTIKEWHKKSPLSCQIPLFAYVIGMYYYTSHKQDDTGSKTFALPRNKLDIYQAFVNSTIKGRFRDETINGTIYTELVNKYEELLQKIAILMIHEMRNNINYYEDVSQSQEFSRKEIYAINVERFDAQSRKELEDIIKTKKADIVLSDVINNYFFSIDNRASGLMVRFSDLNVMCCFAASYIYDVVIKLVNVDDDSLKEVYDDIIKKLENVELQPQVMDFLMFKIQSISEEERETLLYYILECIKGYEQHPIVSQSVVKAMIILYLIFIKFYNKSYKTVAAQNLPKSFYRLCRTAKSININGEYNSENYRYLAERYFMECTFIGCQFKRLNYKYYNFSRSTINNSSFEQCNFLKNEFVGAQLKKSNFKLCNMNTKLEKVQVDDVVEIDNSMVSVDFEDISTKENATVVIKNSTVQDTKLVNIQNGTGIKFIFENCLLSDIKIRDCKKIVVEIKDCIPKSNKISVDTKSVVYSDNAEFFKGDVRPMEFLD